MAGRHPGRDRGPDGPPLGGCRAPGQPLLAPPPPQRLHREGVEQRAHRGGGGHPPRPPRAPGRGPAAERAHRGGGAAGAPGVAETTRAATEPVGRGVRPGVPPARDAVVGSRGEWAGGGDLFTSASPTMKFLYLDNNGLGATLHLTGLPPSLKYLYLNHNRFMGRPDLSRLPTNLELHLEHNYLSGVVFTTTLHPGVLINPQKGGEVVLPEKKTRSCVVS